MARLAPDRHAIVVPTSWSGGKFTWAHLTFAELDRRSDVMARGLEKIGVTRGVRTVLMVPPSLDFFPLVFALFKVGAVMVLIDPGIGRSALLKCLDEVDAEAFIGVPAAHVARLLFPKAFGKVRALVTVGGFKPWGGVTLKTLEQLGGDGAYAMAATSPDEVAAVLFTSGSTGIPKGAVYTHGMFDAQVRLVKDTYGIAPGEIDLPTFPLFALFDPALGMTAIIPDMDFRKPAKADPEKLIRAISDHGVTSMFGSPALLDRLSRYGEAHQITLPTLKRVLSAGAPVRNDVLKRMGALLTGEAQIFTPFGATESLPVASIGSREVLAETQELTASGKGVCVGRPVAEMTVRIIQITDEPIAEWSDALLAPAGAIGEITARGPVVTREYFARPEQTRLAKIREGSETVHRMGDVGYFDDRGRLWMCGRKGHRVVTPEGTLFTVPCEEIFNQHPAVLRSALVGVGARGQQRPILVIEQEPGAKRDRTALAQELLALGARFEITRGLKTILFHDGAFPVDVRHNAKIERERLASWAKARLP